MSEPLIELSDVRFRWPAAAPTLDIPSLAVAAGERLFIRGPSGGGKTTLLHLLGGFTRPDHGQARVLGTDFASLGGAARDAFRADNIGVIFQMFNLVPYLSLVENVALPCLFSAARRARAIERGGDVASEARRLLAAMHLDPAALEGRSVVELSTGQQQRVAVARALIGAPPLVLADEPTSALDPVARDAFLDLLIGEVRASGATLVLVSHDSALEAGFDRVLALDDINRAATAAPADAA